MPEEINWWKVACLIHPIGWMYLVGDAIYNNKNPFVKSKDVFSPKLYYNRGLIYLEKGDFAKAIQNFSTAIQLDSNYGWAYGNRGCVRAQTGDYLGALDDFNKAIELLGDHDSYYHRGNTYMFLKDYHRALQDYNQALILCPTDSDVYFNRGAAYFNLGAIQEAITDIEIAATLFQQKQRKEQYDSAIQFLKVLKHSVGL